MKAGERLEIDGWIRAQLNRDEADAKYLESIAGPTSVMAIEYIALVRDALDNLIALADPTYRQSEIADNLLRKIATMFADRDGYQEKWRP